MKRSNHICVLPVTLMFAIASWSSCGSKATFVGNSATLPPSEEAPAADGTVKRTSGGSVRSTNLNAATAKIKPVVKFLMVVDDSTSMAPKRTILNSGVSNLMTSLKGQNLNLDVRIITVTDLVRQVTKYQYPDAKGIAGLFDSIPIDMISYKKIVTNEISNALFSDTFKFRENMASADFDVEAARLKNKITTIPPSSVTNETGICSALRALNDTSAGKFFTGGDKAVTLFISDEDSHDAACVTEVSTDYVAQSVVSAPSVPCVDEANCQNRVYQYRMSYTDTVRQTLGIGFSFTRTTIVDADSGKTAVTQESGTYSLSCYQGASICVGSAGSACTVAQSDAALRTKMCGNGTCTVKMDSCTVNTVTALPDLSSTAAVNVAHGMTENRCTLVSGSPTILASLSRPANRIYDYATCTRAFIAAVSTNPGQSQTQTVRIAGTPVLKDLGGVKTLKSFNDRAIELFGANGYRAVAIIRDEASEKAAGIFSTTDCPAVSSPDNHFEFGLAYRNLVTSKRPDGSAIGSVHSICSGDYSPALKEVESFISSVLASSIFSIQVGSGETVSGVSIKRAGTTIVLKPTDFKVINGQIEFADGVLQQQDEISVEIASAAPAGG